MAAVHIDCFEQGQLPTRFSFIFLQEALTDCSSDPTEQLGHAIQLDSHAWKLKMSSRIHGGYLKMVTQINLLSPSKLMIFGRHLNRPVSGYRKKDKSMLDFGENSIKIEQG